MDVFLSVFGGQVWTVENAAKTLVWTKNFLSVFKKQKTEVFENALVWTGPKFGTTFGTGLTYSIMSIRPIKLELKANGVQPCPLMKGYSNKVHRGLGKISSYNS